jgi:hypothetical protein
MPPIRISAEALSALLSEEHAAQAGFPPKGEVELSKIDETTWMITLVSGQKDLLELESPPLSTLHQKVLRLLKTHRLPDLIEGRFERFLSSEELKAFQELLQNQKIVVVKSNPKFEKGIYREAMADAPRGASPASIRTTSSAEKKIVTHTVVHEKPVEEYTLVQDGFMILRSDGAAKVASFDLQERIRAGEIKGIKSFDGFYYIIENSLLEKFTTPLLSELKAKKKDELSTLALAQAVPPILARIVLEFAKEDGVVIEKQKNLFAFVG